MPPPSLLLASRMQQFHVYQRLGGDRLPYFLTTLTQCSAKKIVAHQQLSNVQLQVTYSIELIGISMTVNFTTIKQADMVALRQHGHVGKAADSLFVTKSTFRRAARAGKLLGGHVERTREGVRFRARREVKAKEVRLRRKRGATDWKVPKASRDGNAEWESSDDRAFRLRRCETRLRNLDQYQAFHARGTSRPSAMRFSAETRLRVALGLQLRRHRQGQLVEAVFAPLAGSAAPNHDPAQSMRSVLLLEGALPKDQPCRPAIDLKCAPKRHDGHFAAHLVQMVDNGLA